MTTLKDLLKDKKFIRMSPITGVTVEGRVKDIDFVINYTGKDSCYISFFIRSTNDISYDMEECEFVIGNTRRHIKELEDERFKNNL